MGAGRPSRATRW